MARNAICNFCSIHWNKPVPQCEIEFHRVMRRSAKENVYEIRLRWLPSPNIGRHGERPAYSVSRMRPKCLNENPKFNAFLSNYSNLMVLALTNACLAESVNGWISARVRTFWSISCESSSSCCFNWNCVSWLVTNIDFLRFIVKKIANLCSEFDW